MDGLSSNFKYFADTYSLETSGNAGMECSYYLRKGNENAVLILPGIIGDGRYWFKVLNNIPGGLTVVALNYPATSRLQEMNEAIGYILQSLEVRSVTILGQSFGGYIAQLLRLPGDIKISGIILSNTATGFPGLSKKEALAIAKRIGYALAFFKIIPALFYKKILNAKLKNHVKHLLPGQRDFWIDLFKQIVNGVSMETQLANFRLLKNIFEKEVFSADHDTAVLILEGDSDNEFTQREKDAFHLFYDGKEKKVIGNSHHLSMIDQFEIYMFHVQAFIERFY